VTQKNKRAGPRRYTEKELREKLAEAKVELEALPSGRGSSSEDKIARRRLRDNMRTWTENLAEIEEDREKNRDKATIRRQATEIEQLRRHCNDVISFRNRYFEMYQKEKARTPWAAFFVGMFLGALAAAITVFTRVWTF